MCQSMETLVSGVRVAVGWKDVGFEMVYMSLENGNHEYFCGKKWLYSYILGLGRFVVK
jgi:hypothetical protein